ncbi:MAG: hypothetical protein RIT45_4368 [Pseudomonadota bacterium]
MRIDTNQQRRLREPLRLLVASLLAGAVVLGSPARSSAAVPTTTTLEGTLLATAGPAADGDYALTLTLWDAAEAGKAVWSEQQTVKVVGGRFVVALGAKSALDPKVFGIALWLGVQVGAEPELPRQPLRATPLAMRAALAEGLDCVGCVAAGSVSFNYAASATKGGPAVDLACTGCVSVVEMKFDGDVDLGGNSLKAAGGTFTGDVVAKTVTATTFVGDGSKLTGIKTAAGACGKGQAVVGIDADGKLQCKSLADALPADGLDEVSGGLLTTQFSDTVAGQAGVAIPDNTGASAFATLTFPDLGATESLKVQVKLGNTDLSKVAIKLLPPDDKKVGLVLCDPCGDKDSKSLDTSFPDKTPAKSGDFAAFVGKSVAGEWTLVVTDTDFCIKQAPGNGTLCDLDAKTDGSIEGFTLTAGTLASGKVGATGVLQLHNAAQPPAPCTVHLRGGVYFDTKLGALRYCDGKVWRTLADTCGNGIVEPSEECDDGNNTDGDGCSATCVAAYGLAESKAGKSCKDIKAVNDAAGAKLGDGVYWVDPDGSGGAQASRAWCDQTSDGGGWTLAMKVDGSKSTFTFDAALWANATTLAADQVSTAATEAKYAAFSTVALTELRLVLAAQGSTNAKVIPMAATSLQALFSGSYKATSLGRNAWKALMPGGSAQPNCNREGVNAVCGSRTVRLGLLTNQENDCESCDSYIGVGHSGQNGCDGQGASWAGMMASCSPDNGNKNVPAFAWVYVR